MDFETGQIIWNETEYKLKFVLDTPNFVLPQTVQVVQGHMIDEDDAIASGQVLTIYDKKRIEKLVGSNDYGKEIQVNTDCQYKVHLMGVGKQRRFTSVSEFCFCETPPKYLRIESDVILATGDELQSDWIIETGEHVYSDDGRIIGIVCDIHNDIDGEMKKSEKRKTVTLPVDYKNIFIETISPETKRKAFTLMEIIQQFKFPFQIEFLPVNDRNCCYGPQLGIINIHRKKVSNMVLATSVIEGVKHALSFSADLPITLQVAVGINESWSGEALKMQQNVDLKKFDYLADIGPYDTAVVQRVYDELHTPSLPRRSESAHAHRHRNYSSYASHAEPYASSPVSREKPPQIRRNKSMDFSRDMKDFERYVKSKLGFKKLKNTVTSKLSNSRNSRKHSDDDRQKSFEYDTISNATFMTSDDGSSSNGLYSTDMTSTGSGSTFNETYNNIIDCMDAISIDQSAITPRRRRRKGSGDSGICLSARKKNRSRSRSRSRLTPDTPSSNQSDSLLDNFSEWSLPVHRGGNSPRMNCVNINNNRMESNNYLWTSKSKACDEAKRDDNVDKVPITSYEPELKKSELINDKTGGTLSPLNSKQIESKEEIRKLNEEGVCYLLDEIQLSKYRSIFQSNQINGELLLDLEIDDLLNDCQLSLFQAKKLIKYINGWRPEDENRPNIVSSRRKSLNARDWSVNDVLVHMTTINLPDLGRFCSENQVNGDLLLDILDKETLQSLKNDHNVKMSSIDSKKLLNFVVKGWRPDNSPKKIV